MAGNLDKALLQMAGFEDDGDLYAKAGTPFFSGGVFGENWRFDPSSYHGLTGKDFQYSKDRENDAAQIKDDNARLNALLYAWAKDNPDKQITPELIDRMKFFAASADSMKSSGGFLWDNGTANEDRNVKAFVELMQKYPEKVNDVLGKNYNKYNSPVQNYFDWAGQYMNGNAISGPWASVNRNWRSGDFSDNVAIATRHLGDKLNSVTNNPNYGLSEEEIVEKGILAEAEKQLEAAKAKKLQDAKNKENLRRAGFGYRIDNPNYKSTIPEEWL